MSSLNKLHRGKDTVSSPVLPEDIPVDLGDNSPGFSYTPITEADGIRLAIIQPASSPAAEINCSLIHSTLSACNYEVIDHYTVLSYVWGDATELRTIWIDGSPVKITANLHLALRDLRDKRRELRLWADALCINQSDDAEKDIQVAMMGRIYEVADHTIIHIPSTSNSLAMDAQKPMNLSLSQAPPPPVVMDAIWQSQWPTRVWVFQELVFSKDPWIYHGQRRWKWGDIHRANQAKDNLHNVSDIAAHSGSLVLNHMFTARQAHQRGETMAILDLMLARRGLGATDPRDIIWAHTGLAEDGMHPSLGVDYKNRTLANLYNGFAQYVFREYLGFKILFHVESRGPSRRTEGIASWSPDWRQPYQPYDILINHAQNAGSATQKEREPVRRWDGEGYRFVEPSYGPSDTETYLCRTFFQDTLACNGVKQDGILRLSRTLDQDSIPQETTANLRSRFNTIRTQWDVLEANKSTVYPRALSTDEANFKRDLTRLYRECAQAWSTLIQDPSLVPDRPTNLSEADLRLFLEHIYRPTSITQTYGHITEFTVSDWLVAQFTQSRLRDPDVAQKRIALMASGVLAIVPASAQQGDFLVRGMEPDEQPRKPCFLMRETHGVAGWDQETEIDLKLQMDDEAREDVRLGHTYVRLPVVHCVFAGVALLLPASSLFMFKYRKEIEEVMGEDMGYSSQVNWTVYVIR